MALEALIERLCVAVEQNTAATEKLVAGRDEAIAQLTAGSGGAEAPKTTRGRKKADDAVVAAVQEAPAEQVVEQAPTPTPAKAMRQVDYTTDGVFNLASGYLQESGITQDEMGKRAANIKAVIDHFGATAGIRSIATDEQRYQATFFLERFKAGLPVNFGQDYDFDGDPLFDQAAAGAASLLG
jgi:hypothetical protein